MKLLKSIKIFNLIKEEVCGQERLIINFGPLNCVSRSLFDIFSHEDIVCPVVCMPISIISCLPLIFACSMPDFNVMRSIGSQDYHIACQCRLQCACVRLCVLAGQGTSQPIDPEGSEVAHPMFSLEPSEVARC